MKTPTPEALDRIIAANWWYHQLELTEGRRTPGKYGENLIPVANLLKRVDLRGMQCLDIGAMDGKMSFWMERAGGRVLAVDGVGKDTVPAMIEVYGSTVRYRSGIVVEKLPTLLAEEGLFDFVLCSGVAYHVYSPFDLVANVRHLLRNGGMALFETAAFPNDKEQFMALNRGDFYNEYTTLWIPTTACFRYMLQFFSLRVLGEAELRTNNYPVVRHTWLVQAERPNTLAVQTGDPWLATLLSRKAPGWSHEYLKPQFDHDRFESTPDSKITASSIAAAPIFKLEEPQGYAEEASLLARATPAWRCLD